MAEQRDILDIESDILGVLKNIYDPEIPVNIYDLGLIYEINVNEDREAEVKMTLTAPNCPIADQLLAEVNDKVNAVDGLKSAKINLVFDPPWDKDMMTDEAKLELGFL